MMGELVLMSSGTAEVLTKGKHVSEEPQICTLSHARFDYISVQEVEVSIRHLVFNLLGRRLSLETH